MEIQWFPGHMAKARRQVEEKLNQVDLIFEILDARLPMSSRNPMIDDLIKEKPRLVLLSKSDLADPAITRLWTEYFEKENVRALPLDILSGKGVKHIVSISRELMKKKIDIQSKKGIRRHRIRGMVLGVPNVGKSALINRLAGRSTAKTGDRPGVTRAQQWIKLGDGMELLDTPGILWPKFEDRLVGLRLAASGAIKEEILSVDEVALYLLQYLSDRYPDSLKKRYNMENVETSDGLTLLKGVGKRRGCMRKGGEVDLEKAAEFVLRDLQSGRLGRISLEFPSDWEEERDES